MIRLFAGIVDAGWTPAFPPSGRMVHRTGANRSPDNTSDFDAIQ